MGARDEFRQVYHLDVVQIPTNKPVIRVDHNDLFFKTEKGKFLGLVKKVHEINGRQQPLLIGARNVETAHRVAKILDEQELPYQLLTAEDNRSEAQKIIKAGGEGMVTVATNMAGRGTDILLGNGVERMGGLYVMGTERHESRRIDDQLIGRAGRQGEPGQSQFMVSMEDEIMQLFGSEKIIDVMEEYDIPEDEYISGKSLDLAFKKAQDFVESKNYDSRIYLYKYDRVVNFQRTQIYTLREQLLENEPGFSRFLTDCVSEVVKIIFSLRDAELIAKELQAVFNIAVDPAELRGVLVNGKSAQQEAIGNAEEKFSEFLGQSVAKIQQQPEVYVAAQKLILSVIDTNWSNHLDFMDVLKEEANLFSYSSIDPLIDFIEESKNLYNEMGRTIQKQFLRALFLYLSGHGMLE